MIRLQLTLIEKTIDKKLFAGSIYIVEFED